MISYCVYFSDSGNEHRAIDISEARSSRDVDVAVALAESCMIGSVNWYGVQAATKEDAIKEAIDRGYARKEPEYMLNLHARISEFE